MSHRRRRMLGTLIALLAIVPLAVPAAQASDSGFRPAMLNVTGWKLAGPTLAGTKMVGAPLPNAGDGIGPGSYLLITRSDGTFICTANFVWNGIGGPYLGAAGHCFLPPSDSTLQTQPLKVEVCVRDCAFGGQLGAGFGGTFQDLGSVVFAQQEAPNGTEVGNDFGLVRIAPAAGPIRLTVPVWNGPTPIARNPLIGDRLCFYGNAAGLGEVFATKARFGIAGVSGADSWYATMPAAPGDSGSAVVNCPRLTGTNPAGILTHLATNGTGVIAGTTVTRAIEMVQAGTSNHLAISVAT